LSEERPLLERPYIIPLRKAYYVPRGKRANKAVTIVKGLVKRHLHVSKVVISSELNAFLWSRNREKPPRKVKVVVKKIDKETAEVDLASD